MAVAPRLGEIAKVAGALAFGTGLVLLVIGRAELFSENFFDPAATAFQRRVSGMLLRFFRLRGITFVLNLVGGALFALTRSVHGVLPEGTRSALVKIAEEIAARGTWAGFVSAIIGGALVALLSFLLQAVNSPGSRIAMAYMVGFILAVGPFVHVVVTVLHVLIGILLDAPIGFGTLGRITAIATAGNLVVGAASLHSAISHKQRALASPAPDFRVLHGWTAFRHAALGGGCRSGSRHSSERSRCSRPTGSWGCRRSRRSRRWWRWASGVAELAAGASARAHAGCGGRNG